MSRAAKSHSGRTSARRSAPLDPGAFAAFDQRFGVAPNDYPAQGVAQASVGVTSTSTPFTTVVGNCHLACGSGASSTRRDPRAAAAVRARFGVGDWVQRRTQHRRPHQSSNPERRHGQVAQFIKRIEHFGPFVLRRSKPKQVECALRRFQQAKTSASGEFGALRRHPRLGLMVLTGRRDQRSPPTRAPWARCNQELLPAPAPKAPDFP